MAKKLKTKVEDIRKLSDANLDKELQETYRRLFNLRLQWQTRQITNFNEIPKVRRQVARLKTIQKERQIGKAAAASRRAS